MTITKFKFDMYDIGDRLLEGVMIDVEVNEDTNEIVSIEYEDNDARGYVEGIGAKGTADHWLNEAKEMLGSNWKHYVDE